MGKVLALSKKGTYEVPKSRFFNKIDLIHGVEGLLGGMENAEGTPYESGFVKVVAYFPTVELVRIPLAGGKFLDAVVDFTGNVRPVGIGSSLDERGEPVYEVSLEDKEFPVEVGKISQEEYEEIKNEIKEAVEEGDLPKDALSKEPLEVVKELLAEPKKLKITVPTAYALVKKAENPEEVLVPPEKVTAERVLKEGERFTLNGIAVGADDKGNVVVFYVPERIATVPATKVAKEIHERRPDFKVFSYLAGISESVLKDDEKRERIRKKVKEMLLEAKEKGGYDKKAIKEFVELWEKAFKEPTEENVKALAERARKEAFKVIRDYLKEEGLISPAKSLIAKAGEKMFLRNNPDNAGLPVADFKAVERMGVVAVPRIIENPKEGWQVKFVPKPLSLFGVDEKGNRFVINANPDSYVLSREYKIYKALKPFYTGKMGEDKEVAISQLRKLYGEGFENFKGFDALKKELSEFKNANQLVRFIDYVKEQLDEVLFKKDATVEEIREVLSGDPVIKDFMEGMKKYLADRPYYKAVKLSAYTELEGKEAVKQLLKKGIIFKGKDGSFRMSRKALSKLDEKEREKLEESLKLKTSIRTFAALTVATLNATERAFSADFPAVSEAEKVAKHVETAYTFGEKGIKVGEFLIPDLGGEEKEVAVGIKEETINAWKAVLKGKEGETLAETEKEISEKEVKEAEKQEPAEENRTKEAEPEEPKKQVGEPEVEEPEIYELEEIDDDDIKEISL